MFQKRLTWIQIFLTIQKKSGNFLQSIYTIFAYNMEVFDNGESWTFRLQSR